MSSLAKFVIDGIHEIQYGLNQSVRQDIAGRGIEEFLLSQRGLSLVFDAMNRAAANRLFYVTDAEWKQPPRPAEPAGFILDCHTHYRELRTDPRVDPGTHPAPQYRRGARGNWWFFPKSFNFANVGEMQMAATPRADLAMDQALRTPWLHNDVEYSRYLIALYIQNRDRSGRGHFGFFATPAPHRADDTALDGVLDTASWTDMQRLCHELEDFVGARRGTVCYPTGVIQNTARAPVLPAVDQNVARLWKIYPSPHWDDPGPKAWLQTELPGRLRALSDAGSADQWHTVLIHWWDDDDVPKDQQGRNLLKLLLETPDIPNIRFVIFHACYPNVSMLADLLQSHNNVFAEIGGTFANQILGSSGADADLDAPGGPAAAREMLMSLRGRIANGIGENDGKILWGTDAIWHGSPAWQIDALRRLNLTNNEREDTQFKDRVFGGNARQAFSIYGTMCS